MTIHLIFLVACLFIYFIKFIVTLFIYLCMYQLIFIIFVSRGLRWNINNIEEESIGFIIFNCNFL